MYTEESKNTLYLNSQDVRLSLRHTKNQATLTSIRHCAGDVPLLACEEIEDVKVMNCLLMYVNVKRKRQRKTLRIGCPATIKQGHHPKL